METVQKNGYIGGVVLLNPSIREMRTYVEYQKFLCRMLIDNDDTREMKNNTQNHGESLHRFIYNNPEIDKFSMRGKNELIGKSVYSPTASGEFSTTTSGNLDTSNLI